MTPPKRAVPTHVVIDDPTTEIVDLPTEDAGPLPTPVDDEAAASALMELIASPAEGAEQASGVKATKPERVDGIVVAHVVGLDGDRIRVDFAGNWTEGPVLARSLVDIDPAHVGREVALSFERGKPDAPIVTGLIQRLADPAGHVVVDASDDLVLRCGKASITLTKAGKIIIRGEYLLARATGVNRIQGGTVEIN